MASGSKVFATKALPYSKCRDHFVWLGRVTGFKQPLELYQLRRASGRKMNSELGADHPSTLTSMANLASTYWNQGRWDAAEALEVEVMETRKTKLRADHPDTLTSMNNLAFTWKGQGRDTEAINLMSECVELRHQVLGAGHPNYISSLEALAGWVAERVDNG
jgi:hypothetical protein